MDICKMNARDNTPLRTLIAAHLDEAGECTALAIAKAVGKGDVPSVVVKELNAMRTDGQVECERRERGKKKGLVYWLAVPLEVAASNVAPESADDRHPAAISESVLPAGMRQGTRAAQIYRVLPAFGAEPIDARAIATTTGCAKALIDGALRAMVKAGQCVRHTNGGPYGYTRLPPAGGDSEGGEADVKAQTAEIPPQITPEIPPTEAEDDAMPPADASLLALANRELADRLARVAHVLRGSGLEGLKGLDDGADLQTATAALTGAYQVALANLQARGEQFLEMQDELNRRDDELLAQASTIADLRSQLAVANAPADISTDRRADLSVLSRASETLEALLPPADDIEGLDVDALAERVAERVRELEADLRKLTRIEADMVNHPPHYQGKVECIDAIEAALGAQGFVAYCRGNALKYSFRAGRKGDFAEDILKARWYANRALQTLDDDESASPL